MFRYNRDYARKDNASPAVTRAQNSQELCWDIFLSQNSKAKMGWPNKPAKEPPTKWLYYTWSISIPFSYNSLCRYLHFPIWTKKGGKTIIATNKLAHINKLIVGTWALKTKKWDILIWLCSHQQPTRIPIISAATIQTSTIMPLFSTSRQAIQAIPYAKFCPNIQLETFMISLLDTKHRA